MFLKRKVGVTEHLRTLNSSKAVTMAISSLSLFILVLSARARCMTWHVNLRALYGCAVAMGTNVLNCCTELYYYLSNRVGGEDNFFDFNRCDEFGNSAKRFTQGEMHITSPNT